MRVVIIPETSSAEPSEPPPQHGEAGPRSGQLNTVRFTFDLQQLLSGGGSLTQVISNPQQQTISWECLVPMPSLANTNKSCLRNICRDSVISQRAILARDIEKSDPEVIKSFAQYLLFLCLTLGPSPIDGNFLQRDENDWLDIFRAWHTQGDFLEPDQNGRLHPELQRISLFRDLLKYSGGRTEERDFDLDYCLLDNALLYADFFGVSSSYPSEHFDPNRIRTGLSKSKLFSPNDGIPDPSDWHIHMAIGTQIGLMFLELPSAELSKLSVKDVRCYIELADSIYEPNQHLRVDPLTLLIASWTFSDLGRDVVANWIFSIEGLDLYKTLLEEVKFRAINPAEFVLSLSALLARQKIIDDLEDHTAQPEDHTIRLEDCISVGFNAIVHGRPQTWPLYDAKVQNTIKRLPKDLVERVLLLDPLEGAINAYWEMRLGGGSHEDAYEAAELIKREEEHTFICTSEEYDDELTTSARLSNTDLVPKTWFKAEHHGFDSPEEG